MNKLSCHLLHQSKFKKIIKNKTFSKQKTRFNPKKRLEYNHQEFIRKIKGLWKNYRKM